uniref:Uncharacterized protein n=1 Tax=Oryza punctata TaxID=4537 RepID=A0A0E0KID9_ORYPU
MVSARLVFSKLKICTFGLRRKRTCHVNRWVGFFSDSRARHITFDFTSGVKGIFRGLADGKYIFPCMFSVHVFSGPDSSPAHTKSLHLSYVCLNTATTGFTGFANLKKLTVHKVTEANIELLHKSVLYGDNLDYICTKLPAALPHVQKLSITSTLYIYDES